MAGRPRIRSPQDTALFRAVAFFSRLQLGYLFHSQARTKLLVILFALTSGSIALGIITIAAYITRLPLLFPPLAPSAFILFYTPLSPSASPRNVFLSHTIGLMCGLLCLKAVISIWPESTLLDPVQMNWHQVLVIALSTSLVGLLMIVLRCVHPPATATALIAALGYFKTPFQMGGLVAAVIFLLLEAALFIRVLGGLPYPLWKANPRLTKSYRELAEGVETRAGFWEEVASKIYKTR